MLRLPKSRALAGLKVQFGTYSLLFKNNIVLTNFTFVLNLVTEGCPPPVLTALHQTLIDLNVSEKHEFSLDTKLHLW